MANKRANVFLRKTTNTLAKVNRVAQPALGVASLFGVPGAGAAAKVLTAGQTISKEARRFV